jgi:beta-glucosidase-like glycosyl hydrolase
MKKLIRPGLFMLSVLLSYPQFLTAQNDSIYKDSTRPLNIRVISLLSQLTLPEKISLLSETAPGIPRLGILKYYHGNEALHGVVRPGKFTVFPQAIGLASTWNPDLIFKVSSAISDEARGRWNELAQGKNQLDKYSDLLAFWSPTINMARDPRWGRTPETYGEDPFLTSKLAVQFVKGLQGNDPRYLKVVSTPKHFAANNEEHNRFECNANISEKNLREYYLPAFEACIREGKAQSIMTAYNSINGIPCTANKWLVTDILRKEWGFAGYVVSDCGAPGNLFDTHHYATSREDAAAMAMNAGVDLECSGYCEGCYIYRDFLIKAYKSGKVSESQIDSAAFHVLRARFKLGLFDDPASVPYNKISPSVIGCREHKDLALETARQSIVLLKNNDEILPLSIHKLKRIAVLGINAATCEFGDYSGSPINEPISPLQGIHNKAGNKVEVKTLPWQGGEGNTYLAEKQLVKDCDVVIAVLGINKSIEMEGLDRTSLDLPADQMQFLKEIYSINKNIIVVLVAGSSLAINWINDSIPAIVNAWYPGEQGGNALADILFGDYNPAGRLPLTYYNSLGELPDFNDYAIEKGRTYQYFKGKALYPFGFGLSYTTFEYSDLSVIMQDQSVRINFKLGNTGKMDGDEVVQAYIQYPQALNSTPLKRLKAFKRIHLEKGKNENVLLEIDIASLRVFDEHQKKMILPKGRYEVWVAASLEDVRLKGEFLIQ